MLAFPSAYPPWTHREDTSPDIGKMELTAKFGHMSSSCYHQRLAEISDIGLLPLCLPFLAPFQRRPQPYLPS